MDPLNAVTAEGSEVAPRSATSELLAEAEDSLDADPAQAASLAAAALTTADERERARAHFLIGTAAYRQGRPEEALPDLAEAKAGFLALGNVASALECQLALGRAHRDLGAFSEAAEAFSAALELAVKSKEPKSEIDALNLQAGVESARGEYPRALEMLEEALALARRLGLRERQANVLNNLGTQFTILGEYPRALESLTAAYDLYREVAAGTRSQATNLISLGHLYQEMGDGPQAEAFFAQAREVARCAHDPLVEAAALNNLAITHKRASDWAKARDLFQEALGIARRVGARQYEIDNLDGLGQVYVAAGDYQRAAETHTTALAIARDIGDKEGENDALINLGRDHLAMAQLTEAVELLNAGLVLAKQLGRQPSVFEAHELLAQAYEQRGDLALALQHHRAFHRTEKAVFNQESEERTRQLKVQFAVERSRLEAEEQRRRTRLVETARDEAESMVRARTRELEEAHIEIATRLATAGEFRDDDTGEHTRRVGRNAAAIAHALGWPEDEVQLLFIAARLHDVGKIAIRDAILHKTGELDADEVTLMRTHTTIGARILSAGNSRLLKMAEEIALAHHERWDGKGYPLGLSGEAIPMSARIVAVADVLDALTHERPYKRAWTVPEALAELARQSGRQFDPKVVAACLRVFRSDGVFSPTDATLDWTSTASELRNLQVAGTIDAPPVAREVSLKERYEKLLLEKTRELEAARREATQASRHLHELAFTDPLTNLGNRRAFEADLETEVARTLRYGDILSVLAIDIDMLKALNDSEGHQRGDFLLRTFAVTISRELRTLGRVYRVGGDEFMAVFTHTGTSDFPAVQERLTRALGEVRETSFPGISVSFGLAALPEEAGAASDLMRLVDQRLHDDKERKRG